MSSWVEDERHVLAEEMVYLVICFPLLQRSFLGLMMGLVALLWSQLVVCFGYGKYIFGRQFQLREFVYSAFGHRWVKNGI